MQQFKIVVYLQDSGRSYDALANDLSGTFLYRDDGI